MATLILDFDGTLADTLPILVEIAQELTGKRQLSAKDVDQLRAMPMFQALRKIGLIPWNLSRMYAARGKVHARMREVPAFQGIPAAIRQLHDAGNQLFVLSSNRTQNVEIFLTTHHLSQYISGVYHCGVFRKGAGLRRVIRQNHIAIHKCLYVANEPADMEEARSVGVGAIAVTWSGQDRAALSRALPQQLIDDPQELTELYPATV